MCVQHYAAILYEQHRQQTAYISQQSRNTLKYIKIVKQITKKINKKFKKSNKIENLKAEHEYEIPSCSFKEKKLL